MGESGGGHPLPLPRSPLSLRSERTEGTPARLSSGPLREPAGAPASLPLWDELGPPSSALGGRREGSPCPPSLHQHSLRLLVLLPDKDGGALLFATRTLS